MKCRLHNVLTSLTAVIYELIDYVRLYFPSDIFLINSHYKEDQTMRNANIVFICGKMNSCASVFTILLIFIYFILFFLTEKILQILSLGGSLKTSMFVRFHDGRHMQTDFTHSLMNRPNCLYLYLIVNKSDETCLSYQKRECLRFERKILTCPIFLHFYPFPLWMPYYQRAHVSNDDI